MNDNAPKPERLEKFLNAKYGNIVSELADDVVGRVGTAAIREYGEDFNDPHYQKKREKKQWVAESWT